MNVTDFVSRLDKVRSHGGQFTASCPGPLHQQGDRHPSLSVRESDDGKVLVKCFSGCTYDEIVGAMGLTRADLFQKPTTPAKNGKPSKVFPSAVLDLIRFDASIIWLIGCDMSKGKEVSEEDYKQLCQSMARLERIAEAAYGR